MERIQPLLSIAFGVVLVAIFRMGADWISPFLRLQPLPGVAAVIFLWASLDLRLRLREREESQAAFELTVLAAGSSARAELYQFWISVRRMLLVATVLSLPTWGMPGAWATWIALLGALCLGAAVMEGGTHRWGAPDFFLGLSMIGFWLATSGLEVPLLANPTLQVESLTEGTTDAAAIGVALRTASAQAALAIGLRIGLMRSSA